MVIDAALSPSLWLKVVKVVVYLYNYTPSVMVLGNIDGNKISPNDLVLNNADINCFSLINYKEYLYFRVYRCRVYTYIL